MNPLSRQHLKLLRQLHLKKFRDQTQRYLIEGLRLCEEAAAEAAPVQEVIVDPAEFRGERAEKLVAQFEKTGAAVYATDAAGVQALADTQSPQGIICVVEKKRPRPFDVAAHHGSLVLALDGISDPGNLGTILRTADWFGIRCVVASPDTAESTNAKVVRGTMGALFRLQIHENSDLTALAAAALKTGYRLIAAVAREGVPAPRWQPGARDMLFIGNEAHGLSADLEKQMTLRITIAKRGGGESLNAAVAASILMYQWSTGQDEKG